MTNFKIYKGDSNRGETLYLQLEGRGDWGLCLLLVDKCGVFKQQLLYIDKDLNIHRTLLCRDFANKHGIAIGSDDKLLLV